MKTLKKSSEHYQQRALWAHLTTVFFFCALLALFSINQWLRPEGISLLQWSVQCLPLLMFWLGLRKRNRRTYLWLCFVILLYFIKGVEGVMSPAPEVFDWVLLIASVGVFIGAMVALRYCHLHIRAEQQSKNESLDNDNENTGSQPA